MGIIYQYHLDEPLNDRKPSRHYTGFCELGNLAERDRVHRRGVRWAHDQNGRLVHSGAANFLRIAGERGIGFGLVRAWRGTRADERRLKRLGHAPEMCPVCCAERGRRPRVVSFLDEVEVEAALRDRKPRRRSGN